MSTIEEIWQLALPQGTRLVAGQQGLWREVSSTARLRPRLPGFDSLQGGELAFVSLQSMRLLDENLTLAAVLAQLGEMNVAAVAAIGQVDAEARSAADRYAIPLFELPAGTGAGDAEQFAMRVIVERQAEVYRRGQDAYRQLTELAIEGRGLAAIVERLANIAGKPTAMQDASGNLRLYSSPREGWLSRLEASALLADGAGDLDRWLRGVTLSASDPPVASLPLRGHSLARLVAPIVGRQGVAGFLVLLGELRQFSDVDRLAVARGAAACAIELARKQAAIDAQDQLQVGIVDELLASSTADLEAVRERALRLGYDLAAPHAVMVFQMPNAEGRESVPELARAVERELARERARAPLRPRGPSVAVLYPLEAAPAEATLKRLAAELRSAVAARLNRPALCAGLGRFHAGVEGLRLAYAEAEQALSLGLRVLGTGRVIYFGDLGLYRLLFNVKEKDELRAFHDEMLGRLIDYDRRNGADLAATLAAYFAARNSPTEAAERMHLHRNTFLYRLHRIREITGFDLDDPETRLSLHLALRIGETLQAAAGPGRDDVAATPGLRRRGRQQGQRVLAGKQGLG